MVNFHLILPCDQIGYRLSHFSTGSRIWQATAQTAEQISLPFAHAAKNPVYDGGAYYEAMHFRSTNLYRMSIKLNDFSSFSYRKQHFYLSSFLSISFALSEHSLYVTG